jgi:hypothetical protein
VATATITAVNPDRRVLRVMTPPDASHHRGRPSVKNCVFDVAIRPNSSLAECDRSDPRNCDDRCDRRSAARTRAAMCAVAVPTTTRRTFADRHVGKMRSM